MKNHICINIFKYAIVKYVLYVEWIFNDQSLSLAFPSHVKTRASNFEKQSKAVVACNRRHLYPESWRQNYSNMADTHKLDLNTNGRIIGQIMPRL